MSRITIQLTGVAAELALGNYMPKDTTIFNNWEEFYHYNDLIHESQLLMEHISEIQIQVEDKVIFSGKIPSTNIIPQKSSCPVFVQQALYLRTECAEEAIYKYEFESENFDKQNLFFETQDYDLLFKIGKSFLSTVRYNDTKLEQEWISAKPVGNLCVLCRFENGFLVPIYDAIKKLATNN